MRRSAKFAWSLIPVFFAETAACIWLGYENGDSGTLVDFLMITAAYLVFAGVGALIASRRPENSIGWIFLAVGVGAQAGNLAQLIAEYGLTTQPGSVPGAIWFAWFGNWMWPASIVWIMFLLILFPSGRPTSRFSRVLLWAAGAGVASLLVAGFMLTPGPMDISPRVANPLGWDAGKAILTVIGGVGAGLIPLVLVVSIGWLIVRARRSRGIERQQLKWFAYAAAGMFMFTFVINSILEALFPDTWVTSTNAFFAVGLALIPIATGTAILRFHLYEIDLIINRTLVYGALTAILVGVYLGIVFVLQELLQPITEQSDIAVAASTLAVAALFRPIRRRVQAFIDQRFYRRKYDAQRTLEEFGLRLRDEVDLDQLRTDLVSVVSTTIQPRTVSLWLRGGDHRGVSP